MDIIKSLSELQDLGYRDFHARLMPTVDKEKIIGIRTPALRAFAKKLYKSGEYAVFMSELPHRYYEENNLHAFLIEQIKDFDPALFETEKFLPYIDNWATCDCFFPSVFKKNKPVMAKKAAEWMKSDDAYAVRFGIGVLMKIFLDGDYKRDYMELVAEVKSDKYYINMMIAWYFATALAKQYDDAVEFLINRRLDFWVHNKAIQKAVESRRISDEKKLYLKGLKEVRKS